MDKKYDVIIIGAGIGGLVCGCYLKKAGLHVLIIEKHNKPGGYCTSFSRHGYRFDVAIHYLGGCKKNGQINKILCELGIKDKIKLIHYDPTDRIVMPDHSLLIRQNAEDTIEEFKREFPEDSYKIDAFFQFIRDKNFYSIYGKAAKLTFRELLDCYFDNYKLKATLSTLLGNIGLSDSKASALTAIVLYRDFILSPGFYPKGGMQTFSDLLANCFKELGGTLLLNSEVVKIMSSKSSISGVMLSTGKIFESNVVVSNSDAYRLFNNLLDIKHNPIIEKTQKLKVSISAFAVYLGLKVNISKLLKNQCAIWYFDTYDMRACYDNPTKNIMQKNINYIVCTFPSLHSPDNLLDKSVVEIFMGADFKTEDFWEKNKNLFADKAIKKAEEVIPEFSKYIDIKVIATPQTFYKYTFNRNGAIYGWASTPGQIDKSVFPQKTSIEGLYLTGHWCTNGLGQGGISGVSYSGRNIAKIIANRFGKKLISNEVLENV